MRHVYISDTGKLAGNRLRARRNVGFPRLGPDEPSFQPRLYVSHGLLSSRESEKPPDRPTQDQSAIRSKLWSHKTRKEPRRFPKLKTQRSRGLERGQEVLKNSTEPELCAPMIVRSGEKKIRWRERTKTLDGHVNNSHGHDPAPAVT